MTHAAQASQANEDTQPPELSDTLTFWGVITGFTLAPAYLAGVYLGWFPWVGG